MVEGDIELKKGDVKTRAGMSDIDAEMLTEQDRQQLESKTRPE
jgi:hypothetical protein